MTERRCPSIYLAKSRLKKRDSLVTSSLGVFSNIYRNKRPSPTNILSFRLSPNNHLPLPRPQTLNTYTLTSMVRPSTPPPPSATTPLLSNPSSSSSSGRPRSWFNFRQSFVTPQLLWRTGAVLAGSGIVMGAFGAHGLKNRVGITPG